MPDGHATGFLMGAAFAPGELKVWTEIAESAFGDRPVFRCYLVRRPTALLGFIWGLGLNTRADARIDCSAE